MAPSQDAFERALEAVPTGRSVALVAVCLLAGVAVLAATGLVGPLGSSAGSPTTVTPVSVPQTVDDAEARPGLRTFPPGLDHTGITDPDALVAGHADRLSNTSYRCSVRLYQITPMTTYLEREKVFVAASPRLFATRVDGGYQPLRDPVLNWTRERYVDGSEVLLRVRNGSAFSVHRRTLAPGERAVIPVESMRPLLARLLDANDTEVAAVRTRGETDFFVVRGTYRPTTYRVNQTLEVTVREDGLVTDLERGYDLRGTTVFRLTDLECSGVGRTRVVVPEWVQRARNDTG